MVRREANRRKTKSRSEREKRERNPRGSRLPDRKKSQKISELKTDHSPGGLGNKRKGIQYAKRKNKHGGGGEERGPYVEGTVNLSKSRFM